MAEQVLDLERKVQAPVLKFFKNQVPKAFEDVLNFERKIQKEIVNLFKNDVEPPPPVERRPPPLSKA